LEELTSQDEEGEKEEKIKMKCSGKRGEETGVLNTKALICLI
jgi:hypothetical protein